MQDAFGVETISKTLANNPRGLVTLLRYTGGKTARVGGAARTGSEVNARLAAGNAVRHQLTSTPLAIEAPKYHLPNGLATIPKEIPKANPVSDSAAAAGNQAAKDAAQSVKARAARSKRIKFAAGTAGLAAGGGGAVLGADAIARKRKSNRVHLAG